MKQTPNQQLPFKSKFITAREEQDRRLRAALAAARAAEVARTKRESSAAAFVRVDMLNDPVLYIICILDIADFHTVVIPKDEVGQCSMALAYAAERGDIRMVMRLLDGDPTEVKIVPIDIHWRGDAALIVAAKNGHVSVVYNLIHKGANIHASADAALRIAVRNGHTKVARLLLKNGANPEPQGCVGVCLKMAERSANREMCKLLREYGAGKVTNTTTTTAAAAAVANTTTTTTTTAAAGAEGTTTTTTTTAATADTNTATTAAAVAGAAAVTGTITNTTTTTAAAGAESEMTAAMLQEVVNKLYQQYNQ